MSKKHFLKKAVVSAAAVMALASSASMSASAASYSQWISRGINNALRAFLRKS